MAHGTPDWGITSGYKTVYQLTDLAELAVRLNSAVSFDRRGDVIFYDTFDEGEGSWIVNKVGTGADVFLYTGSSLSSMLSMVLRCGTGADPRIIVSHTRYPPAISKVGLEIAFARSGAPTSFSGSMWLANGSVRRTFSWKRVDSGGLVQINDKTQGLVNIASGLSLYGNEHSYHILKMVADMETMKYERLLLNDTSYVISAYEAPSVVDTGAPNFTIEIVVTGDGVTSQDFILGHVILTQNEP